MLLNCYTSAKNVVTHVTILKMVTHVTILLHMLQAECML